MAGTRITGLTETTSPATTDVVAVDTSTGTKKATVATIRNLASATPTMDGTGAVGTSGKSAREDHVHPSDTSRAAVSHAHAATDITSGTLDAARLPAATTSAIGASELATSTEAVTGTDTARVAPVSAQRQAFLSWLRDTIGEFVDLPLPTFNLFAPSLSIPGTATFTRASSATRVNAAGLIESVTTDGPRYAFDPLTGLCRGLRLEGASTNATTYSEAFDNAAWAKTRASVTADATTAPDGTATADKLVEDSTASNTHYIGKTMVFVSGTTYTISLFIKAGERTKCKIYFPTDRVPANAEYNLSTKEITPAGAAVVAYGIEELPNGRLRCWLTATATVSGSGSTVVFLNNGESNTYTGDGTSGLYLWGAQLEESPFPTSYIPTTSASVTRAADILTAALSGIVHNTAAGAVFLAGRTPSGSPLGSVTQILAQIDDGSANNRITVERTAANLLRAVIVSGGTTVATLELGTVANDTDFRVGVSWAAASFAASLNGGTAVTDSDGAAPSGLTTIRMGADHTPANFWNGFLRHAAFFPRALTSAQLQSLSL